jgi:ATP-dependent DNA helicase RecG
MPDNVISLQTPIMSLADSGIPRFGPAAGRKLGLALAAAAGKTDATQATVEDLLNYLPMRYEDRSAMACVSDLQTGDEVALELYARVAGAYQVGKNRGPKAPPLHIFEITANDPGKTGKPVVVWWFVSGKAARQIIQYQTKRFARGARFVAYGKWEWDGRRNTFSLRLNKPDELEMLPLGGEEGLELFGAGERESGRAGEEGGADFALEEADENPALAMIHVGRRVPVYRKLGEFQTKRLREVVWEVLQRLDDAAIHENLPAELRARQKLISRAEALRRIHFPPDDAPLAEYERSRSPAHLRLIFEEFFWVSLALAYRRGERAREPKGAVIEITPRLRALCERILPFTLTTAQERVTNRIFADMASEAPMNRLVQGDVGSGKTIVAVQAMLAALENGYQAALMAPTEILAEQHARNVRKLLEATPYRVELLIGSLRAAVKRKLHEDLAAGEIHAAIGTHALIQDKVNFAQLGLAVIDEQHRFGVMQRAELMARGYHPDVLVMTATPIPRSLAMTVYGDLDVSVIDELPPGRTPVKTVVVGEEKRGGVYKGIERELKLGRQAYVVYPLVEESEKMDLKDATRQYEKLRDEIFPQYRVGLLHGKMKPAEKEEVMGRFSAGETHILVSTTVIEVGVDVPNASIMVIEHAERFGLSQLHQLRGRVGRGAEQSFCVLLTTHKQTNVARERLGIMEQTTDGFLIAEKDLEIRGPGEVMGTRQSGEAVFRIGNIVRDVAILEQAREEAAHYLTHKRHTRETSALIERVRSDPRFGLAAVG